MADNDVTRIAGNIGAMNALNALTVINKNLSTYQTRLASGKRINSAADDPAGLTIATKMQARSQGLTQALNNIGDAKNLLAVAESGLGRINDILIQMRNKAEAGASDTMGESERQALIDQMVAYSKQIDDIVDQTKWTSTSQSLIGGYYDATALTFQTGVDNGDTTTLDGLTNLRASDASGLNLASQSASSRSVDALTNATGITTAVTASPFAHMTELSNGSYDVKVHFTASNAVTIQLFNHGETTNPIMLDLDGAGGTTGYGTQMSATVSSSAATAIDLGNGMSITVATAAAGFDASAQVDFTSGANTYALKLGAGTLDSTDTAADFASYMETIENKLDTVSGQLSQIGALTGRLTFKEDQISAAQINTESAYNRIMNANMAEEQVNASKYLILQQTATAMLSQANAAPQFLLSLFQ